MHGINAASQRLKLLSRAPIYYCPNLYFLPLSFTHTVLCHSLSSYLRISLSLSNPPPGETLAVLLSRVLKPSPRILEPCQPSHFCGVHTLCSSSYSSSKLNSKRIKRNSGQLYVRLSSLTCFKDKDCISFVFASRI